MESNMDAPTTTKRLVALLGDAICHFGRTECDCHRQIDPADWLDDSEIEKWLKETRCPKCHTKLAHFSGLENIPAEYNYCPDCNDKAYSPEGEVLLKLL